MQRRGGDVASRSAKLIERHCGGIRGGWDNLLAVIPGGSSVPLVPAHEIIDAPMDFDTLRGLKSGLGTAAVIVMDKSTDVIRAIAAPLLLLQARELRPVHAVPRGHRLDVARDRPHGGRPSARHREIDMLLDVTTQVEGHTICALGDAAAWPIQGLIRHFRPEIEKRIEHYAANPHSEGIGDPLAAAAAE